MRYVRPRNLEINRPPILVDECEKFGLSEMYGAGKRGDLVRIARPLETAGAARMVSEDLLDIRLISRIEREENRRKCTERLLVVQRAEI